VVDGGSRGGATVRKLLLASRLARWCGGLHRRPLTISRYAARVRPSARERRIVDSHDQQAESFKFDTRCCVGTEQLPWNRRRCLVAPMWYTALGAHPTGAPQIPAQQAAGIHKT
jgi:hypothetical protein